MSKNGFNVLIAQKNFILKLIWMNIWKQFILEEIKKNVRIVKLNSQPKEDFTNIWLDNTQEWNSPVISVTLKHLHWAIYNNIKTGKIHVRKALGHTKNKWFGCVDFWYSDSLPRKKYVSYIFWQRASAQGPKSLYVVPIVDVQTISFSFA